MDGEDIRLSHLKHKENHIERIERKKNEQKIKLKEIEVSKCTTFLQEKQDKIEELEKTQFEIKRQNQKQKKKIEVSIKIQ